MLYYKNLFLITLCMSLSFNASQLIAQPSNKNINNGFDIEITWKNNEAIGINVQGLSGIILETLNSDFTSSGKLAVQNSGAKYTLNTQLQQSGSQYSVVLNLYKQEQLIASRKMVSSNPINLAHHISDFVYEMIFNKKGIFSTRLSYVVESQNNFKLMISDSDGKNAATALNSKEPIISVAWSPSGKDVAYVSFENKKPVVYIHNLASGQRRILANYAGNNSAPSWSPDGKYLALALSLSGNTQIYKINANGTNLVKLTNSSDSIIDTEPQFSADGQNIYFTSDRGGEPQIYKMSKDGEINQPAQRVTFKGIHNTSPRVSPDGEHLAYITKNGGWKLQIQNLKTNNVYSISNTSTDESPSFAANGDYIIYSTKVNGKSVLAASAVEGKASYILSLPYAKIKHPTWGPFMQ